MSSTIYIPIHNIILYYRRAGRAIFYFKSRLGFVTKSIVDAKKKKKKQFIINYYNAHIIRTSDIVCKKKRVCVLAGYSGSCGSIHFIFDITSRLLYIIYIYTAVLYTSIV